MSYGNPETSGLHTYTCWACSKGAQPLHLGHGEAGRVAWARHIAQTHPVRQAAVSESPGAILVAPSLLCPCRIHRWLRRWLMGFISP